MSQSTLAKPEFLIKLMSFSLEGRWKCQCNFRSSDLVNKMLCSFQVLYRWPNFRTIGIDHTCIRDCNSLRKGLGTSSSLSTISSPMSIGKFAETMSQLKLINEVFEVGIRTSIFPSDLNDPSPNLNMYPNFLELNWMFISLKYAFPWSTPITDFWAPVSIHDPWNVWLFCSLSFSLDFLCGKYVE